MVKARPSLKAGNATRISGQLVQPPDERLGVVSVGKIDRALISQVSQCGDLTVEGRGETPASVTIMVWGALIAAFSFGVRTALPSMKWMPHSVFACPRQRPARGSSPGLTGAGAGRAADRGEALRHQRMARQAVVDHVFLKVLAAPMGQRVDLDAVIALVLEEVDSAAVLVLEALSAGDPAVERCEGTLQRLNLADVAAAVGRELMERAVRVLEADASRVRADGSDVAEVQLLGQLALVLQRLGEEHSRVDEENGCLGRDD